MLASRRRDCFYGCRGYDPSERSETAMALEAETNEDNRDPNTSFPEPENDLFVNRPDNK
jgi:hypothetical protein